MSERNIHVTKAESFTFCLKNCSLLVGSIFDNETKNNYKWEIEHDKVCVFEISFSKWYISL